MKENLSTSVSVTTSYAGEAAKDYIEAALKANVTLGKGTITIRPNIKYKEVIKKLATSGLLANATCDFTPIGTITLTEKFLEPKSLQVNLELCKDDFRSDWEAISMGYSATDYLPKNFSDYLIGNISASIGAALETNVWAGVDADGGFSGLTLLFKADATVLDASGTTITSSNVQAELGKVVAKIATTNVYLAGEKPLLYCATDIVANYLISLGGFGAAGVGGNGYMGQGPTNVQSAPLFYAGIQIVETPGMPTGEMVCAQKSNLMFGTGLYNDTNAIKLLDMADLDGSENVRFVARFTGCVNFGVGAEIVYYWIY